MVCGVAPGACWLVYGVVAATQLEQELFLFGCCAVRVRECERGMTSGGVSVSPGHLKITEANC